jgi:hypothetical protein
MRRNHNPLVALLELLLLALIVTWICGGCSVRTEAATEKTVDRFTTKFAGNGCTIITDNDTGVQYLYYRNGAGSSGGSGLTKLETTP